MYTVKKTLMISAGHKLNMKKESLCNNPHGHNWKITVTCKSHKLNKDGMVIDFTEISQAVRRFDHTVLNDFLTQPTAERLAWYIAESIGALCTMVEVEETPGNLAVWERSP